MILNEDDYELAELRIQELMRNDLTDDEENELERLSEEVWDYLAESEVEVDES